MVRIGGLSRRKVGEPFGELGKSRTLRRATHCSSMWFFFRKARTEITWRAGSMTALRCLGIMLMFVGVASGGSEARLSNLSRQPIRVAWLYWASGEPPNLDASSSTLAVMPKDSGCYLKGWNTIQPCERLLSRFDVCISPAAPSLPPLHPIECQTVARYQAAEPRTPNGQR
jgi:hypothetical protein